MSDRFDAVDHAILSEFLKVERPPEARDVDLGAHLGERSEKRDECWLCLKEDAESAVPEGQVDYFALCNAVARLVVAPVARQVQRVVPNPGRADLVRPSPVTSKFLCAVRWYDPGPCRTLEGYVVGYLPGYERYVLVTVYDYGYWSGYGDMAMISVPADRPAREAVEALMLQYWEGVCRGLTGQPWEAFWVAGTVGRTRALDWARRVWGAEMIDAVVRDRRQPGPVPDGSVNRERLDAIVERRRALPTNVHPLSGGEGYRVLEGTRELRGSLYMEIRRGRADGLAWHEDSLYVSYGDFSYAAAAMVFRHLRCYEECADDNNLPKVLGLRVAADWEKAAGLLEAGAVAEVVAEYRLCDPMAEKLMAPATRHAVARMYRDLAAGVRAMYEEEDWVCIIGI